MNGDEAPTGTTEPVHRGPTNRRLGTLLVGHLSAVALSVGAGVLIGGWIAFETDHWQEFKGVAEALGDSAVLLAGALVLVAVIVSAGIAVNTDRL